MDHGPYDALSGEGGSSIPEGHCCVQIHFAAPADCKIDGCHWIEKYPSIPAGEIQFPDEYSLSWILISGPLDEIDDGL